MHYKIDLCVQYIRNIKYIILLSGLIAHFFSFPTDISKKYVEMLS